MQVLPGSNMSMGMPSPSLTNPDMILPFDNPSSEESSPASTKRPAQLPSPPMGDERHARSGSNEHKSRLKHSGHSLSPFRNGVLSRTDGPTRARSNSDRGNGRIKYENSRLSYRPSGQGPITSSPTLPDDLESPIMDRLAESPEQEDLPVHTTYKTPSILDEDENDPESHAAMTRRAEEILANAKKRLTVRKAHIKYFLNTANGLQNMEGNLNRARSTLGSRPSSSMSSFADRDPVSLYSIQKERRAHGGFSPLKHRQAGASLKEDHQGHSRVFSETSVPSSLQTITPKDNNGGSPHGLDRNVEPTRNWFWNGLTRSASVADRHKNGLQPLNEDGPAPDSFERQVIREEDEEESEKAPNKHDPQASAVSTFNAQNPHSPGLTRARSTNQMRDLRDQMSDLKGKISTLKQRAREDSLRRRSLQSLRTPSPLNNAEQQDYSKVPLADVQNRGTGLGLLGVPQANAQAPVVVPNDQLEPTMAAREPMLVQKAVDKDVPMDNDSGVGLHESPERTPPTATAQPPSNERLKQVEQLTSDGNTVEASREYSSHTPPSTESEIRNSQAVEDEESNEVEDSLYDNQDYHETVGERHEDRADAFDYEHFFLHSAMGHYGRTHRSSTHSSNYSTETERPATIVLGGDAEEGNELSGRHERQNSVSSVSSAATFATATEGETKEIDDDWTPRQTMAGTWLVESPVSDANGQKEDAPQARPRKQGETKRERSTKKHRREHSVTENGVTAPAPETPELLEYLASLVSQQTGEPVTRLILSDSDKELADRVVKSLAMVCSDLHGFSAGGGKYEARVCRRKLDTARRYLDGEVNGEAF